MLPPSLCRTLEFLNGIVSRAGLAALHKIKHFLVILRVANS